MKCSHVSTLKAVTTKNKLASKDFKEIESCYISDCGLNTKETTLCLTCFSVVCKTHRNHFIQEKHNIGINLKTMEFYCFKCDGVVVASSKYTQLLTEISVYVNRWIKEADLITVEPTIKAERKASEKLKIPGLTNLGNTCFFNSVMQCLLYTKPLAVELLEKKVALDQPGYLTDAFAGLFAQMHSSTSTVTPKDLFSRISSKFKIYRGFQQQDSHELLRLLLDEIREEGKRMVGTNISQSFVDSVFKGRLVSSVVCSECGYISCSFEEFFDLSLPVAQSVAPPPVRKKSALLGSRFSFKSKQSTEHIDGSKSDSELLNLTRADNISSSSSTSAKSEVQINEDDGKPSANDSKKSCSKSIVEKGSFPSISNLPESDQRKRWVSTIFKGISRGEASQAFNVDTESCISKFMQVEVLEGEDAWACEKCWKTVNPQIVAQKELEIKEDKQGSEGLEGSPRTVIPEIYTSTDSINLSETITKSFNDLASSKPVESDYVKPPSFSRRDNTSAMPSPEFKTSPGSPSKLLPAPDGRKKSRSNSPSKPKKIYDESGDDTLGFLIGELDLGNFDGPVKSQLVSKLKRTASAPPVETARPDTIDASGKPPPIFRKAFKRYLIHKPPEILVLNFKRFQQMSGIFSRVRKLEEHVNFAQEINLATYLADANTISELLKHYEGPEAKVPDAPSFETLKYRLYGVVVHSGNLLGGHYISFVNVENNDWIYFSDSHVRPSSWEEVSKAQAYMLFYQRS